MPLNQLLFSLFKYKQLSRRNPEKAGGCCSKYSQHCTNIYFILWGHFFYHGHVWSKLFGQVVKVWGGNWIYLDALALNAATIRVGKENQANHVHFCKRCNNYTHATFVCPFSVSEKNHGRVACNFSSAQGSSKSKPINNYLKGVCRIFNSSGKCVSNSCQFKHICALCGSFKHRITDCPAGDKTNFVNDY